MKNLIKKLSILTLAALVFGLAFQFSNKAQPALAQCAAPLIAEPNGSLIANVGTQFNYTLEASGQTPISFSANLPSGLSINNGNRITGTPNREGTERFTVTATNACGSFNRNFTIVIQGSTGGAPSCFLSNSGPIKISNGQTNLGWTVFGNPTSGSLSPSVSGSIDATRRGTISTGQLAANTTFTMTVRNSNGSGTCSTKVVYKPAASTGYDVSLSRQDPIFTRLSIPGGYDTTFGYFPFLGISYVPGGFFVVNGFGNSGAGRSAPREQVTSANVFESGGMYGFKDDGTYVGTRDVIFDSSSRSGACFEGGGCSANVETYPLGEGSFVRDLNPVDFGIGRGPITYRISSSGFSLGARLFFHDLNAQPASHADELLSFGNVVTADGKIVGISERNSSDNIHHALALEVLDQNMTKLASFSSPLGSGSITSIPTFYPIVGVGNYIIGYDNPLLHGLPNGQWTSSPLSIYKMPSTSELLAGAQITAVSSLDITVGQYLEHTLDTSNPNRVAILALSSGGSASDATNQNAPKRLVILEATASELKHVEDRTTKATLSRTYVGGGEFAVSGSYVAYGRCPAATLFDGARGGANLTGCELIVEKNGQEMSVEPLPLSKLVYPDLSDFGDSQMVRAVAMSPNGKILVATSGGPDNGNLYMYQIGGVPINGAPPGPNPGNFGSSTLQTVKTKFGDLPVVNFLKDVQIVTETDKETLFKALGGDSLSGDQADFLRTIVNAGVAQTKSLYNVGTIDPGTKESKNEKSASFFQLDDYSGYLPSDRTQHNDVTDGSENAGLFDKSVSSNSNIVAGDEERQRTIDSIKKTISDLTAQVKVLQEKLAQLIANGGY